MTLETRKQICDTIINFFATIINSEKKWDEVRIEEINIRMENK